MQALVLDHFSDRVTPLESIKREREGGGRGVTPARKEEEKAANITGVHRRNGP